MKDLIVRVQGAVTESNFDEYKEQLIAQIKSANKELKIDEDFVEAEKTVKQLQAAEKAIVKAKSDALEQAAEVQRMFEQMDGINEEARQTRLSLQRQIKQRKDEIRQQIINLGISEVKDLILSKDGDFKLVNPSIYDMKEFEEAIKGKKTLNSMQSAIDDLVVDITVRIDGKIEEIQKNRDTLNSIDVQHKSLFQDESALLSMSADLLQATIDKRIATHEAEELKRKQQEAEQAEAAKIETEKQQQKEAEKEPEPEIEKPAFEQNNTDTETQEETTTKFVLTIELNCSKEAAVDFARQLENELSSNEAVTQIKLGRG